MGCAFTEPFDHSPPVHHGGIQLPIQEWPHECLWAQLQYERQQHNRNASIYTNTAYLANLENEWARRGICPRCHRDIDHDLDEQMSDLESRAHDAAERLGRIRRLMAVTPDTDLRPKLMGILDET
jgi:hypothetical protein